MLWWKCGEFLMSFLKAQVSFPSNLASILSSIKNNSSILFFSSNIIYFGQKKPKVQILEIFSIWHCDVVTPSKMVVTRSKMSCADVSFRRCDNFTLRRYQDVATTFSIRFLGHFTTDYSDFFLFIETWET